MELRGFSGVVAGARAAMRGLAIAARSSDVRRAYLQLVGVLFVVTALLDTLGIWAVVHWTSERVDAPWWIDVALVLLRIVGIVLVLLVAPVLALSFVNAVFPILAERVFLAGMRVVAPALADELAQQPGRPLVPSATDNLVRMLLFAASSFGAFLVSLIPIVGAVIAPPLQMYLTARALGWELLDPYFDKRAMPFGVQRKFVAANRAPIVGFGLPFALIMAVPLVGPLVFGLAQAAAGVLVAEVLT